MAIYIRKSVYDELCKAFGHKDLAKLTKKRITDKNGHTRTVWVRAGEEQKTEKRKAVETAEPKNSSSHTIGDHIIFRYGGNILTGKIVAMGRDGVTVSGTGKTTGGSFRVPHKNIQKVTKMMNPADAVRGLMDSNSVKAGWRTDGMQPESCDTIEGLYKTVEAARAEFSRFTDSIADKFAALNPIIMKRATLKNAERIKEKLREDAKEHIKDAEQAGIRDFKPEEYDEKTDTYHCRTIRDCDGHTICLNSIEEVANILKELDGRKEVARIKNNFAKPSPVGYSDINANIKLSNGAIVELQVNTTANMVAKERYGHALYEVYRSVASNPKYSRLALIMGEAQKALYGLSNRYSKDGNFQTDNIPKGKDGNVNIFDGKYKHEPYAKAIRKYIDEAKSLFERATKDGVLTGKTAEHFEHLIEYIK